MRASGIRYLIAEGARHLVRNRLMSMASIGVLVACLLLVGAAFMFSMNMNSIMGYVETQNEIVVFVEETADEAALQSLGANLKNIENIRNVTLVTKEESLEQKRLEFGDDAFLLDEFEGENNPLLDSYVLTLNELDAMDQTLAEVEKLDHIYSIRATRDMASAMTTLSRVIYIGGIIIVAILIVVSMVIISNTIKLTVFSRRKEINIMKYVGATDTFIRLPFVMEGILLGLISATISYLLLWGGYSWLYQSVSGQTDSWIAVLLSNLLPFSAFGWNMLGVFAVAGLCVGIFGSGLFVRKHLKV